MASSLEAIQHGRERGALAAPDLPSIDLPPRETARRRLTMLLVAGGAFLATLDLFIVNIAFDTIRSDFAGSSASLSWVLTGYGIVFAALLVPAGRLADVYGRRRLFRLGMVVFTAASAGCAAAPTVEALIAFRLVQASGAALMVPTSLGLLLAAYPAQMHRRIIGSWSAISTTAAAFGPPIGGVLVDINWRWIFLINLPVAIPAIVFGRLLPQDEHDGERSLPDFMGAALLAVGVAGVVAALSNASHWGVGDSRLWGCAAVGSAAIIAFLVRCARQPQPIVDLALLKVRQFGAANGTLIVFSIGFAAILLGGPLYLQQVWDYSSTRAGIAYAPGPAFATVFALASGHLPITRRVSAVIGCLSFAGASVWWLLMLGSEPHYLLHFLPGSALSGMGVGFGISAMVGVGAAALPNSRYATGTGILNTSRQIGSAVGVAILVAIVGASASPTVFQHAYLFTAVCGFLACPVAWLLTEPEPAQGMSR